MRVPGRHEAGEEPVGTTPGTSGHTTGSGDAHDRHLGLSLSRDAPSQNHRNLAL